jgi:hypothetical protein
MELVLFFRPFEQRSSNVATSFEQVREQADRVRTRTLRFMRSARRFNVADEENGMAIDGHTAALNKLIRLIDDYDARESDDPQSPEFWWTPDNVGAIRTAAAKALASWTALCSPELNRGEQDDESVNLAAYVDGKIRAFSSAESDLDLALMILEAPTAS